ncbi:protein SIEVE ELEMENT OCCLUSION B-like [Eucalyptus grandis]|uniref:protein SIEVE ELEMENT OCCLUSION B-like n=1 Tax=Eucalyptus grandis TaxID=71139 RepID=UPI00192EB9AC|nr:protein SIEVE ELEMENT OCCLUSION B-like [Eucalyptus grandis]
MDKRALSVPPRSGGGGGDSKPKTALTVHISDLYQFIESVIGKLSYDHTKEAKCKVDDLLGIVKNIISVTTQLVDATQLLDRENVPKRDLPEAPDTSMQGDISRLIEFISCQMTCPKEYKNMEEKWNEIFQMVGSYRWTTQVLLVLAAFALQYGDFWYASEAPPEDRNAMSGYLWKALSPLKKKAISDGNKVAIKPLNDVVKDLCEWTTSLFDLIQLVYEHRGKHLPELASAFQSIPWWSCETIIAILAAANIFAQIISVNTTFTQSELEILKLSVSDRMKALRQKVDDLRRLIGSMEEYQKYVKYVEAPVDIADCLRLLLEDDSKQIPFARGPSNTPVCPLQNLLFLPLLQSIF